MGIRVPAPFPLSTTSRRVATVILIVVLVVAAWHGLWLFPVTAAAWLVTGAIRRHRLLAATARRCAAIAATDRTSTSFAEDVVVADLAACAMRSGTIEAALDRASTIHDPWRRLLAEGRLHAARDQSKPGLSYAHTAGFGAAVVLLLVASVAHVTTSSLWFLAAAIAAVVVFSLFVDSTRWREQLVQHVALRAADDPITVRSPTELEMVEMVRWVAGGDPSTLRLARRMARDGVAAERLAEAATGRRS
jgi:hypothetical protein